MKANQILARRLAMLLMALVTGCAESPTASSRAVATTIEAVSATNITGVVGSIVSERPSVVVRDQNGAPMPGVRVLFTLVAGGGSVSQGSVESDALGQATLSQWVLSRTSEKIVVAATTGLLRVEFHATAEPGPPVTLTKFAGDKQISPPETVVPVKPQVRVSDAYDNAIAGVTVMFAVASGGGSLTDESATTNALGIATLGSWTLGPKGAQSLIAMTAALGPITFEARAANPPRPCGLAVELPQGTLMNSGLSGQECFQRYAILLDNADTYEFTLSAAGFDGRLELRDDAGNEIAVSNTRVSAPSTAMRAVLPAGAYTLVVSSFDPEATGGFDVSYTRAARTLAGCDKAFTIRGVQIERNVSSTDCTPIDLLSSDDFRIRMTAGSRVVASLEDYSLSDNRFEMQNDQGVTVATAVLKDYVQSNLEFTAPADGYYTMKVSVQERYMLTVR